MTARGIPHPGHPPQRGAATLVVVMALFLIMGLLSAYANRSLVFEQRMASSYYRTALSREVSEAGIDWALTMLNAGSLDTNCQPVANGGKPFAQKYLTANAATRQFIPVPSVNAPHADCVRTADGKWTCRCPTAGTLTAQPVLPDAEVYQPSFSVKFGTPKRVIKGVTYINRNGTVFASVAVCSASSLQSCKNASSNLAVTTDDTGLVVDTLFGFVSAIRTPPGTPLTVKGDLTLAGAGLALHNSDPRSEGMLLVTGGACPECVSNGLVSANSESLPGTPPTAAMMVGDGAMNQPGFDVFRKYLGSTASRYRNHPSALTVVCPANDCSEALKAAADAGHQVLYVDGDVTLASSLSLGTLTQPVVLVATGNANISAAVQWVGVLTTGGNINWDSSAGRSSVQGMVVTGGNFVSRGNIDLYYSTALADQLRNSVGGFVRVPGSWRGN